MDKATILEAIHAARRNAKTCADMAQRWPDDAAKYARDRTECFRRARWYVSLIRQELTQ